MGEGEGYILLWDNFIGKALNKKELESLAGPSACAPTELEYVEESNSGGGGGGGGTGIWQRPELLAQAKDNPVPCILTK